MGRKRTLDAESVWLERLARFDLRGLSAAEFCQRERVSLASFYRWRKRLADSRRQSDCEKRSAGPGVTGGAVGGRFVPVSVKGLSAVVIELPEGLVVRVPASEAEALRTAILAVREACREVASC